MWRKICNPQNGNHDICSGKDRLKMDKHLLDAIHNGEIDGVLDLGLLFSKQNPKKPKALKVPKEPKEPKPPKVIRPITIEDDDFKSKVLLCRKPVLVDFWAPWCGPCKALSPIVDQVAAEYGELIRVVKMNTDRETITPMQYGIRGIPVLLLFNKGKVIGQLSGMISISQIRGLLAQVI
jgi:thioredoxin 1